MKDKSFIADLHIHSRFSRSTSPACDLAGIASWARIKGISVVGTGDFTHPRWIADIKKDLIPAEPGLFRYRGNLDIRPFSIRSEEVPVRFMLTCEVCCIYRKAGKTRKNHNLILVPDLRCAEKISSSLKRYGNLSSDGRPILKMDARDLLETVLETSRDSHLIPAHIWTPWFSLLGSKSGFDTIEECFGDLTPYVFALETGLSSDPLMNRRLSMLDRYALVSNSDAHSPSKLGREANIFSCGYDYFSIMQALKKGVSGGFEGTIEFYPEEGKYHFDGHRNCGTCFSPSETSSHKGVCPVCSKPVTVGVMNRVDKLADRPAVSRPAGSPGFISLMPLKEVISGSTGCGVNSKKVDAEYIRLIDIFGSEFNVLMNQDHGSGNPEGDVRITEGLKRVRSGNVIKEPGYDGVYGKIKLFEASPSSVSGCRTVPDLT